MKNKYALIFIWLLLAASIFCQDDTEAIKAQISQLLSVLGNVPAPENISLPPSIQTQKYTGCSDVGSVGSPILLINQVNAIVNEYMSTNTQQTFVQFLHYDKKEVPNKFSTIHTIIFKLVDQTSSWYIGIKLDNHTSGIGTVKFLKLILNSNIKIVIRVLGIPALPVPETPYVCGDLKMIFSAYGNDGGTVGNSPGANRNKAPPGLLQMLKKLKTVKRLNLPRSCDDFKFLKSNKFYFVANNVGDTKPTFPVPAAGNDLFEIIRCSPEGIPIIESIEFDCQSNSPNPFSAKLVALRIIYKIPFSNLFETTQVFGKQTPTAPGNYSIKQVYSLLNIARIDAYYMPNESIAFRFFDGSGNSNLMNTFNCGNTLGFTANPPDDSVSSKDLLGFWGGYGSSINGSIRLLGFVKYTA